MDTPILLINRRQTCRVCGKTAAARRSAPRHGRHDADLVAGLQGSRHPGQEADVLPVHVDVHEPPQLPRLVAQPLLQAGVLPLKRLDAGRQRSAVAAHDVQLVGQLSQGRRYPYGHAHLVSLPLYDVARHGIDAHALLHNPLNSPLYLIHVALQLQYHPAAVLRDIGAADVRDQIKVPAQPPDDGLLDHLLGEGEFHSLLGQGVRSYFRVAGRAPVRSLRASSNDDIVGCTARAGCSRGATASWVLRPAPVMNATTSSRGSTRPSWTSRLKPATTTPPAVSANIPSVSASSRIPSTTSSSLTATACPPDCVITFRAW